MLFPRLHRRALKRVQKLSTLRMEVSSNAAERLAANLVTPFSSDPTQWSSARTCTRIVCMSDTHGKHWDIPHLPLGDVLVHAGDMTQYGETEVVRDLSRYFQHQKESGGFREVVCIAGNHDITFHKDYYEKLWSRHIHAFDPFETREALQHCTYLEDSSANLLDGKINAYGSPWTPYMWNWAFNLERGEALQEVWRMVPDSTDVLITHGPPKGKGDMTLMGKIGDFHLLQETQQRIKPRLHVFGHIHGGYGCSWDGHTLFVNAATLDLGYEAINPCIVIDLPHDKSQPAMIVQPQQWIHTAEDMLFWLKQNGYTKIAEAMEGIGLQRLSLPTDQSLYSSATYNALCDQVGLKRKRHRPVREELRTALCQLYAESFF